MANIERSPELGDPTETNELLGAPGTTLAEWCQKRRASLQPNIRNHQYIRKGSLLSDQNYDSRWWAIIYDQWNEEGDRQKVHEREFRFYRDQLNGISGPVLEAACGTGSILLRLAQLGHDICGFDISEPMLARLRQKAIRLGLTDVDNRVSRQDFTRFQYEQQFAAILIPASSFMLLPTQEAQIACLQNIRSHLAPDGRLLLNFYIPSIERDLLHSTNPSSLEEFGEFTHPDTGHPIRVFFRRTCDLGDQTEAYRWYFVHDGESAEVPMAARWIYKEEFQLLLRLAGFSRWQVFGSGDGRPYRGSKDLTETYWIVSK